MKISGKVALVTGGASGIGKAVSLRLLENGAKLVAIVDLDERSGQKTVSEFSDKFGADRVRFITCDVTQEDQLKNSFQEAYDVYRALDIVANNAGIISNDNRKTIEINLMAVINGTFIAEKLMTQEKRSERGIIINTASMAGLIATANFINSSYAASKFGVVGFTKSLVYSKDAFSKDLRAVAICPALVHTGLWTRTNFQSREHAEQVKIMQSENKVIPHDVAIEVQDGVTITMIKAPPEDMPRDRGEVLRVNGVIIELKGGDGCGCLCHGN